MCVCDHGCGMAFVHAVHVASVHLAGDRQRERPESQLALSTRSLGHISPVSGGHYANQNRIGIILRLL